MAVGYLVVAVGIILANLGEVPGVLVMIVKGAFGLHEAAAGGIGAAILNGFKRGLFSNEAGMGTRRPTPPRGHALPAAPGLAGLRADGGRVHRHHPDLHRVRRHHPARRPRSKAPASPWCRTR